MGPAERRERARRAADMLARHVRLQALSPQARAELTTIVGEAILQGWLHDASMDALVGPALEVVEEGDPARVPIRVVEAERGGEPGSA